MGNFKGSKVERDILNRMVKAVRNATDNQDVTDEVESMVWKLAGDGVEVAEGYTYEEELAAWVDAIAHDVAVEVRTIADDRANEAAQWSSIVIYTAETREYHRDNFDEVEAKMAEHEAGGFDFGSHADAVSAAVFECLANDFWNEWEEAAAAIEDFGLNFQVEVSMLS